ncbi:hypothetical protein TVAG_011270 [Trichomonas vaginalis G3]|uniref:SEC7 domain-containing protein n=1 Tax=Trichomonas vaginalis (strain ATCC PRA-98 / G3) TaxID=412133 RepID=A2FDN4_TRIV3|nr:regulation of ARF protein signal transduction [Trichomonas vaginalis G3]EAX96978.1 hypothetical protein TVAG_011270 [Trichomonas vaginalis G3]KAI5524903.1 regulation of ARF protein signal transduction [Trichomonas vaginalis G3]|eukprot:XP_001309908.1 hypothetical protein [Trichomonas vaginalis G3]
MTSTDIEDISKFLTDLWNNTGYISDGEIKTSIKSAQEHLKSLDKDNPQIQAKLILMPFIQAITASDALSFVSIKFFTFLYSKLPKTYWPSTKVTSKIVAIILDSPQYTSVERLTLYIELLTSILGAAYLIKIEHIDLIFRIMFYLVHQYDNMQDTKIAFNYKTSVLNAIKTILLKDTQITNKFEEPASKVYEILQKRTLVDSYLFPFITEFPENTTSLQVYLSVIITSVVYASKCESSTDKIRLITYDILFTILEESSLIIEHEFIRNVVQSLYFKFIKVMIRHFDFFMLSQISGMIDIIYLRFKKFSLSIINELFVKVLLPYHTSHKNTRIPQILSNLSEDRSILVDLFINDPNKSIFKLIIECMMKNVKKRDHPPRYGVVCICSILNHLIDYQPKVEEPSFSKNDLYSYFKYDPRKSIQHFVKKGYFKENDLDSLSSFLYTDKNLFKNSKSYILCQYGIKLTKKYLEQFNMKGKPLGECFVEFFGSIGLLIRVQNIEFFVITFSQHYFKENLPTKSYEGLYSLCWNCLLLNNTFRDPSYEQPMTFESFVHLNQKIDGGHNIPQDKLREIYDYLKAHEGIDVINHFSVMNNSDFYTLEKKHFDIVCSDSPSEDSFVVIDRMFYSIKDYMYETFYKELNMSRFESIQKSYRNILITIFKFSARICDKKYQNELLQCIISKSRLCKKPKDISNEDKLISRLLFDVSYICPQSIIGEWKTILTEAYEYSLLDNNFVLLNNLIESTANLNNDQLSEFIDGFSYIINKDIYDESKPVLLFTKLASIVESNIDRPMHFLMNMYPKVFNVVFECCHNKNYDNVIESIKTLSVIIDILLNKHKFNFYKYQNTFFDSYVQIYNKQNDEKVKVFIVDEVIRLVFKNMKRIRFGFDSIFVLFNRSLSDGIGIESLCDFAIKSYEITTFLPTLYPVYMKFIALFLDQSLPENKMIEIIDIYPEIISRIDQKQTEYLICVLKNIMNTIENERSSVEMKKHSQKAIIYLLKSKTVFVGNSRDYFFEEAIKRCFPVDITEKSTISEFYSSLIENNTEFYIYINSVVSTFCRLLSQDNLYVFGLLTSYLYLNKEHFDMITNDTISLIHSSIDTFSKYPESQKLSLLLSEIQQSK